MERLMMVEEVETRFKLKEEEIEMIKEGGRIIVNAEKKVDVGLLFFQVMEKIEKIIEEAKRMDTDVQLAIEVLDVMTKYAEVCHERLYRWFLANVCY